MSKADSLLWFEYLSTDGGNATSLRERADVDLKDRWATETMFATKADWEFEFSALEERVKNMSKFQGLLGKSGEELLRFARERDEVESRIDRVFVYASMLSDEDTRMGETQAMEARARSLAISYSQATSWVEPELAAIDLQLIDEWMSQDADLAVYRHAIHDLFRQKQYILSPREEELMALAGEIRSTPHNTYNLLTNADTQFPSIKDENGEMKEVDDSSFYLFMRCGDRRVRKDAFESIVGTHAKHRNTAASLLNGVVQSHIFNVKARDYESCIAASLHAPNIPIEVYDILIKTVKKSLHLLHRHETLRKNVLKLDDGVHAYDMFAPLIDGQKIEYSYAEAVKTIEEALCPLGDDYVAPMKKGFASRWVDVYPSKGKRSGAYSSGTYLTLPFILMNYHGGYEDMSTLAHEMGHSMHSYFSRKCQPYVYSDYSIFCAEVASTCNEIILQQHVLARTDDPRKKLQLLSEFLEGMRGTVFRQVMFSEFEQRIHEMAETGEPLTADSLGATYREIMTSHSGPAYAHDDLVDNYWVRIPHFYYNFYVYKYATSYCAASDIARRIMDGESGARDAYIQFLSAGSSDYPVELLRMAGVDMMTPAPIEAAMKIFENLLDETERLLKELGLLGA